MTARHAPLSNSTAQDAVNATDLAGAVATAARSLRCAVLDLHVPNPGQPSRPTLEVIPPSGPVIYVFVKSDARGATLTEKQQEWADFITSGDRPGVEVHVVTPSTLDAFWSILKGHAGG